MGKITKSVAWERIFQIDWEDKYYFLSKTVKKKKEEEKKPLFSE